MAATQDVLKPCKRCNSANCSVAYMLPTTFLFVYYHYVVILVEYAWVIRIVVDTLLPWNQISTAPDHQFHNTHLNHRPKTKWLPCCRRHFHLCIITMLMPWSQISAAPGHQYSYCRLKSWTADKNGSHIILQTPFSIIHHLSVIIRDAKVLGCQDGCWCSTSWSQLSTAPSHQHSSWWRHQMETLSALLVLCAGNSPGTGEFPSQRPMTRSFGVFFDLRLNRRLSKQSWGWWFEMPPHSLWRHCNDNADFNHRTYIRWFTFFLQVTFSFVYHHHADDMELPGR